MKSLPPIQGKKNSQKAAEFGRRIANNRFKDLQDHPEDKGINFTWSSFPVLIRKKAEAYCFTNFPDKTRNMVFLERICSEAAYQEASLLVRDLT